MNAAWFVERNGIGSRVSLAKVAKTYLADPCREGGVKGSPKYAKREANSKIVKRHYHDLDYEGIIPLENSNYTIDTKKSSLGNEWSAMWNSVHAQFSSRPRSGSIADCL